MHLLNKLLLTFFTLGTLTIIGCQTPETTEVSPEFAIPLINSKLSIQNILDRANTQGLVQVDGDDFITLNFNKEVLGTDTVSLVNVPGFSIPQITPTQTIPTPFPSDLEIDKIIVKNGKLYLNFEINTVNNANVTVTIPTIKKNGSSLQYTKTISNPSGTIPFVYEDSVSLTSYTMDFSNGTFTSQYTATDAVTNTPIILSNFFLNFPEIEFSYIEGYFGQVDFSLPISELAFELFEQWKEGQVSFTDPRILLKFENSYGFPMRVGFDTLQAMTRDLGFLDIMLNGLVNGSDLAYPSLSEVGMSKVTNVMIDKTNSNILTVLQNVPYGMRSKFSGTANPTGNSNIRGFATDNSKITMTVIAELPMEGALQNFTLIDTFALDMTGDNIPEGEAEFKIITNNGFPLDIDLQCYFLDEFGVAIDSMFIGNTTSLMQAAPVDANGRVTAPVQTITFSSFTRDRINQIRNVSKQIALEGRFNSTNNGNTNIKLYSDYDLEVQIGVKIKPIIQ